MTGHGIDRSTFIDADEKTQRGLTHDLLTKIYNKVDENQKVHEQHLANCNNRFNCIEGKMNDFKWRNSKLSGLFGLLGGFLAMVVYWIKDRF